MNNASPLKVLGGLWVAVTLPVVLVGLYLSHQVATQPPVVVTKEVFVTPTATPSATVVPTATVTPKAGVKVVSPTVKGGVK